jgi:hypothetical protein
MARYLCCVSGTNPTVADSPIVLSLKPTEQLTSRIYTLSLELYDSTVANLARYAFEILLAGCIALLNLLQLKDILASVLTAKGRRRGGLMTYFKSGGHVLKLVNNVLLAAGVGLWWVFVNEHAKTFALDVRYPVSQEARLAFLVPDPVISQQRQLRVEHEYIYPRDGAENAGTAVQRMCLST